MIDEHGKFLLKPVYDFILYDVPNDYARVKLNGKWGIVSLNDQWIIRPEFDYILNFNKENGLAYACMGEKCGLVNRNGEWVVAL